MKKNRLVNPNDTKNIQIQDIDIPSDGREVHLKAYGFIKVFRIVAKDGDIEYWATDVLEMDEAERKKMGGYSWKIEKWSVPESAHNVLTQSVSQTRSRET